MFSGHIFSTSFWRNYWIAIKRSRRDRRDRRNVLKVTAWLIVFIGYYGYFVGSLAWHSEGRPGLLIFVPVIAVVSLLVWISNKRDENAAEREAIASVDKNLRTRLAQDGFILATLLVRAGSEATLQQKELPPSVEVITRKVQIDSLKSLGLWDSLPEGARDLLLLPDSHWSAEQRHSMYPGFETLRCLRWVLGIDETLAPLTHAPRMNYDLASSIVKHPKALLAGERLKPTWDIRIEQNTADAFFSRCYAEVAGRGIIFGSERRNDGLGSRCL